MMGHEPSAVVWIAEKAVIWAFPDGEQRPGRIAVGMPTMIGEHTGRCTIALDGFEPERPIVGEGTLQALLLALRLGGYRLHDFTSRGGRVLTPAGDEVGLDAIFGPLLMEAKAPG